MKKIVLGVAIVAITCVSCKNGEKTETSSKETTETVNSALIDSHTSENSLDWTGVYEGTTPCADCSGIKTVLDLKEDMTFTLSRSYLGKPEGKNEFKQKGDFNWDETGSKIILKTENIPMELKVGENQLWMLDGNGNIIEGQLANMYILKKTIQ
jgi:uncharacterized lipoprotein NlpE involved in copper resistance